MAAWYHRERTNRTLEPRTLSPVACISLSRVADMGANAHIDDAYGRRPINVCTSRALQRVLERAPRPPPVQRMEPLDAGVLDAVSAPPRQLPPPASSALRRFNIAADDAIECAVCMSEVQAGLEACQLVGCAHTFCAACLDR